MATDVLANRLANLRALIVQWGGPTSLAEKLKLSGPSYVSQLVGGIRPITEKTARKFERALGLTPGWMDAPNTGSSGPQRAANIDDRLMVQAVGLVGAKLQESNLQLRPEKFAELVSLAYGDAVKNGKLDEQFIERLVQLTR